MARKMRPIGILAASLLVATFQGSEAEADFYYDLDSTYAVAASDTKIAIQFDSTVTQKSAEEFFAAHPCLADTVESEYIGRGYWIYGLVASCGYSAAAADAGNDTTVNRVVPVYITLADSAEFAVTDMVSVQFQAGLSHAEMLEVLENNGLVFVDSSTYRSGKLWAALHDSIKDSPLEYGNALHLLSEIEWACPTMYGERVLSSLPSDPYFANQYYLRNTGQTGGVSDVDIDADSAWLFALVDSGIVVAIIDVGVAAHPDLPAERLLPGKDFVGEFAGNPEEDTDPTPPPQGRNSNHGMACAGILAASHNDSGVVGVCGSCRIIPVKTWSDEGFQTKYPAPSVIDAQALQYVGALGPRVISNSWTYPRTTPYPEVANAIRDITSCLLSESGSVVVFAAGNYADDVLIYDPSVAFPANMPEVIAVGAVSKFGERWNYSCFGEALDVVAPSGEDWDLPWEPGDQWTIDLEDSLGWNPDVTGSGDAGGDVDYTSSMGGTSGACPQVAGLIALVAAKRPDLMDDCGALDAMRDILCQSAEYLYDPGEEDEYGCGRANAFRALLAVSRGEINNDGVWNVLDVVLVVKEAFRGGGPQGFHPGLADMNCDEVVNVLDVVLVVNIAFRGGAHPDPCYEFDY